MSVQHPARIIIRSRVAGVAAASLAHAEKLPPEQADRIVEQVLSYWEGVSVEVDDSPARAALLAPLRKPPEIHVP